MYPEFHVYQSIRNDVYIYIQEAATDKVTKLENHLEEPSLQYPFINSCRVFVNA